MKYYHKIWCCRFLLALACMFALPVYSGEPDNGNVKGVIADILATLKEHAVFVDQDGLNERLLLAVCRAVDAGAVKLTPEQAEIRRKEDAGIFYGIGLELEMRDKSPVVAQVAPESPAAEAGVEVGALIEKINDLETKGMPLTDTISLLRGTRDQMVNLVIRPPDSDTAVEMQMKLSLEHAPVTGLTEEWPEKLAYMRINGIYEGSGDYISEQFKSWSDNGIAGVILDLRGAGGMDSPSVADVSDLFVDAGVELFKVRTGGQEPEKVFASSTPRSLNLPIMALIDADTRGASEILAGVLRNSRAAMLIGAPSRGEMALRAPIEFADDQIIYMAVRKIELYPPPATAGILVPDVRITGLEADETIAPERINGDVYTELEMTDQERSARALAERIGSDAALRRATDILLGMKALGIKR